MSRFARMRTLRAGAAFVLGLAAALVIAPSAHSQASGAGRFVGTWTGALATPSASLRLALTITGDSTGQLSGVLTSLDQGNANIPGSVTVHGDTLALVMAAANASYTAFLTAGRDSLRGFFSQGTPLPLNMARSAPLPVAVRPQDPKPPFPYRAQDVAFESVPGVRLAGTLLLPAGKGPFPAVVFVTGSGPQDRNEELLGHKPFLVIADHLARHGIASLRYDDRGVARSTGNFAAGTSADFANDAEAAVRFLRAQPGIAAAHVGIVGHSEGGMIAPMVAARSRDVGFIVLLSGPGIPGDSLLLLQQGLIAAASGVPPSAIQRNAEANRRLYDAIKGARDSADAGARVSAASRLMLESLPGNQQALGRSQLDAAARQLLAPWMQYLIRYDPRPALRQVRVPVLALGGTLDLQVPAEVNLSSIEAALKAAHNRDYRVVSLPRLNHLFQTATTGNVTEYATISETFSPSVLELITKWINERFAAGK